MSSNSAKHRFAIVGGITVALFSVGLLENAAPNLPKDTSSVSKEGTDIPDNSAVSSEVAAKEANENFVKATEPVAHGIELLALAFVIGLRLSVGRPGRCWCWSLILFGAALLAYGAWVGAPVLVLAGGMSMYIGRTLAWSNELVHLVFREWRRFRWVRSEGARAKDSDAGGEAAGT